VTTAKEVLSCSEPAHARNVESVLSCSSTYLISYAVNTLFDTSVRTTSKWMLSEGECKVRAMTVTRFKKIELPCKQTFGRPFKIQIFEH
jgi:hypothetical protein